VMSGSASAIRRPATYRRQLRADSGMRVHHLS